MRSLPRPQISARTVLELCARSIRDADLSGRLTAALAGADAAEADYLAYAQRGGLWALPKSAQFGPVTGQEMKRVYKDTFAKSAGTRNIYDQIKKLPANDICPICGQRTVGTLDHYLSQSEFAALVVVPSNLLPSCADCNKAKLDAHAANPELQTLHPYFDNIDRDLWLTAEVLETAPAALRFRASPPQHWPEVLQRRTLHHFQKFGLAALYASHSAVELGNMRYALVRIAERGDTADVRAELQLRYESSLAAQRNSWQTAMYAALTGSDWFCQGGFVAEQ